MRILCIHGIGHQSADLSWQPKWEDYITRGLQRWDGTIQPQFEFLDYDHYFEKTPVTFVNTIGGLGSLLMSGAVHAVGDVFRRRRAFGDIGEKAKWTAGMVTRWGGDAKLRGKLCRELEKMIAKFQPEVICAHSLGTLLAYDLFAEQRREPGTDKFTFVTFGSQIGNPAVRNAFGGYLVPIGARRWFNLYNRNDDVFTVNLSLSADNYEQIQTPFEREGVGDHDAEGYLTHQNAVDGAWRRIVQGELDAPALTSRSFALRGEVEKAVQRRKGQAALKAAAVATKTPRRRALLIGINDYPNPDDRLEGCVNDVFLMSSALQECGFDANDIRVVLDDRATAAGIRERLEWLLSEVKPNDQCFLYYSGHGAQLPGYGAGDTYERLDEILVPWDFDGSRETAVTDDHIFDLYSQLPYDASFMAVFDCCHSGGVARAGSAKARGINLPDDVRHRMLRWDSAHEMWVERNLAPLNKDLAHDRAWTGKNGATRRLGRGLDARRTSDQEFDRLRKRYGHRGPYLPLILQACGEEELSYEYKHGTLSYGAFTYSLATILRRLGHAGKKISYQDLRDLIAQQLADLGYQQRPQILGPADVRRSPVPWKAKAAARRVTKNQQLPQPSKPTRGKARGGQTPEQIAAIVLDELESKTLLLNPTLDTNTSDWFADIEATDKETGKKPSRCDFFLKALGQRIKKSFTLGKAELITRGAFPSPLHIVARIV